MSIKYRDGPPALERSPSSDTETSITSANGTGAVRSVSRFRSPYVTRFAGVIILLVIWGVSLLPLIFYVSPLPRPHRSNESTPYHLIPHYPCNHPLILNNASHMCEMPCNWVVFTPIQDKAQQIVDNISLAISLLGFLFILATWIAIKQLRVFPHVIPLYIQGLSSTVSFIIVIGNGMGREKSFCQGKLSVRNNPTAFCMAQGVLIQYFSNVLAMWFVVYSINLAQMIWSNRTLDPRHSTRIHHIISSAACWVLPWIPVAIVLSNDKYAPINMRMCMPSDPKFAFFTNSLITEIAQGVGCTCLFFVVYKLYKMRNLDVLTGEQATKRRGRMDKIAIRLVCLMFAYAVCVALVYIPMCVQLRNQNLVKFYIRQYYTCLMFAPSSSACPADYEDYTYADTWIASYLSSSLFTISTVCFLAFNKQSRRLWSYWWQSFVNCCCPPQDEMSEIN